MADQSATVSAKIPKKLKRDIEDLGINISETVRDALSKEVQKRARVRAVESLEKAKKRSKKLPNGTIVSIIREIRDES